jgi:hypothetical protein
MGVCMNVIEYQKEKDLDALLRKPISLGPVGTGLRNLFRLYLLAEPDGDTSTFFSWIKDELEIAER